MNPTRNIVSPGAVFVTTSGAASDHYLHRRRPEKLLFYTDFIDAAKAGLGGQVRGERRIAASIVA
jgi:hypothetical protein